MAKKAPKGMPASGRAFDQIVARLGGGGGSGSAMGGGRSPIMGPPAGPQPMGLPSPDEMPGAAKGMGSSAGPHVTHIHIHLPTPPQGPMRGRKP